MTPTSTYHMEIIPEQKQDQEHLHYQDQSHSNTTKTNQVKSI